MKCNNCNFENNNNSSFCTKCGTKLNSNQEIINNKNNNKNKLFKVLIILIPLIVLIIITVLICNKFSSNKTEETSLYGSKNDSQIVTTVRTDAGIPKFIDGDFADIKVNNKSDALKALEKIKDELKIKDVNKEFELDYSEKSENITYYRFKQMYEGIEVYNNNVIISVDKDGNVLSFSGYYIPNIDIDITEKKTKEELENIVKKDMGEESEIFESKKYIYADNKTQRLVYVISINSGIELKNYIIDANTGEIISSTDISQNNEAYEFTGDGLNGKKENVTISKISENMYILKDPIRNIQITNADDIGTDLTGRITIMVLSKISPMLGTINGTEFKYRLGTEEHKELSQSGITTLKHFEEIYDYYLNVLGRKSYDNKGSKIIVNIGMHKNTMGQEKLQNAAWYGGANQFLIGYHGDIPYGLSKDVMAHEFTHAAIDYISSFASEAIDKDKAFETGALNEGIADIIGNIIEGKNWTMNESIEIARSSENPHAYEDPIEKGGKYYFPDSYIKEGTLEQFLQEKGKTSIEDFDRGGIHRNSTVVSHAAYLMYNNGAFKSRDEMAKIWYNSLYLMSSYSNFEDCALAVIKTAKNFNLSEESIKIIEEAFIETKMLEDTKVELTGNIISGKKVLENVKIEIKDKDNKTVYELNSDKEGNFKQELLKETYKLTFKKEGFKEYTKEITLTGDTEIKIELAHEKTSESCKSGNCHTVRLYMLDDSGTGEVNQSYEVFIVDHGTSIGAKTIVDAVNKGLGSNILSTDGEIFKMNGMGDFVNFAWYYKGTDKKFSFDKPITEDIDLEMKYLNGMIDDNLIEDIYNNMFK